MQICLWPAPFTEV